MSKIFSGALAHLRAPLPCRSFGALGRDGVGRAFQNPGRPTRQRPRSASPRTFVALHGAPMAKQLGFHKTLQTEVFAWTRRGSPRNGLQRQLLRDVQSERTEMEKVRLNWDRRDSGTAVCAVERIHHTDLCHRTIAWQHVSKPQAKSAFQAPAVRAAYAKIAPPVFSDPSHPSSFADPQKMTSPVS